MENYIILNQDTFKNLESTLTTETSSEPPKPPESLSDILFSKKSKTLKATVKQLLDEIKIREKLHDDLMTRITQNSCKCGTYLLELNTITQHNYLIERTLETFPRRTQLEDQVLGLEKEKRDEDLMFWKDVSALKKYLMSALAEYWEVVRKNEFVNLDIKNEKFRRHRTVMPEA